MQTYLAQDTTAPAGAAAGGRPAREQARALLPAAGLLVLGLAGLVLATLSPTGSGGQYAVIAPPWYTLSRTLGLVRRAGGDIADAGGPANIVIAHARGPGFARALYRAGAWLVVDPGQLRGCAGFAPVRGPAGGGTR